VLVLVVLCAFFSIATWTEQSEHGAAGDAALARALNPRLRLARQSFHAQLSR